MKATLLLSLWLLPCFFTFTFSQWTPFDPGASPQQFMVSISAVDENIVWGVPVPFGFTATKEFFKTTDGGETWTVAQINEASPDYNTIHIFALDENIAWATRLSLPSQDKTEILKTTDGGATWALQTIPNTTDVTACVATHFFNENEGTAFAEVFDGSLWSVEAYFSEDGGTTWQLAQTPGSAEHERIWFYYGNHYEALGNTLWFGTSQGRVFRSTDKGKTWQAFDTGWTDRTIHSLAFKDELHGIAVSILDNNGAGFPSIVPPNQAVRTSDGGMTWTQSPIPASPIAFSIEHLQGSGGAYLLMGDAFTAGALLSTDNGNHWKTISTDPLNCVQFVAPGIGWAGGHSTDGTVSFYRWSGGEQLFDPALRNVETLAGSGVEGFQSGEQAKAKFWNPKGMAMDRQGNVFVADDYNNRIRKITPNGTVITLAGTGAGGYANGPGNSAQFSRPQDVVTDSEGNLYVADPNNYVIRKITPDGMVSLHAGQPGQPGSQDGNAIEDASFDWCPALGIDAFDNIYVASNDRIRKIDPLGEVSTLLVLSPGSFIWGLDADAAGNVYFADFGSNQISRLNTDGELEIVAGSGAMGCTDGLADNASFSYVEDVTVDAYGNVFVADGTNQRVRKIDTLGNVTTLAGNGCNQGVAAEGEPVDGAGELAQLGRMRGILLKPDGNLLVTSWSDDQVREIQVGRQPLPLTVLESVASLKYPVTPLSQVQPIQFGGTVLNSGEDDVTDLKLSVSVRMDGALVFSKSSPAVTLASNGLEVLEMSEPFEPTEAGTYEATFTYSAPAFGDFKTAIREFTISDSVLSNDDGHSYFFDNVDFYAGEDCATTYGQVFELTKGDTLKGFAATCYADNATFSYRVYAMESGSPGAALFTSDTLNGVTVPWGSNFYHAFPTRFYLPAGTYLFVLERTDPIGSLGMGMDSDAADQSAWFTSPCIGFSDWGQEYQFWGESYGPAYMLRPVFAPQIMTGTLEPDELDVSVSISPNPATDEVKLQVEAAQGGVFQVEIFDLNGRLVKAFEMQGSASVGVADWSAGSYVVKVFNEKGMAVKRLVKI